VHEGEHHLMDVRRVLAAVSGASGGAGRPEEDDKAH